MISKGKRDRDFDIFVVKTFFDNFTYLQIKIILKQLKKEINLFLKEEQIVVVVAHFGKENEITWLKLDELFNVLMPCIIGQMKHFLL